MYFKETLLFSPLITKSLFLVRSGCVVAGILVSQHLPFPCSTSTRKGGATMPGTGHTRK
ncbi:MAG: hypothetical protein K8R08_07410 [Methanosarcinales archaeon]|nr:hypothetical protein [Methanosarcinales archaeon]